MGVPLKLHVFNMAAHLFPVIFILVTVYHCACVNSALADGGVEDEDRKRGKNNLSNDREDSGVFHDLGRKDSESLDSLNSTLTPDRVTNISANVSDDGNGPNAGTQKEKRKKNDKGKNIQQPTDPNVKPKGKNLTKTTDQNVKSRVKKKPSKDQLEELKKNPDITRRLRSLSTKTKRAKCPCDHWKPVITPTPDPSGRKVSVEFCDEKRKLIDTVGVSLYRQNEIESTKLNYTKLETPSCQINYTLEKGDYFIQLRGECLRCDIKNGVIRPTDVITSETFTVNETVDQTIADAVIGVEEKDDMHFTIVVGCLGAVVGVGVIVIIVFAFKICKGKERARGSSSGTRSPDLQSTTESLIDPGNVEVFDSCTPNVPDDSLELNVRNVSADSLAKCDRCDSICESDHVVSRQADHSVSSRHGIVTGQRSLTDTGLRVHELMELPKTETHDQNFDGKALVEHEPKVFHCPEPSLNGSCFTLNVVDMCGTSTSACSPDAISDKNHGLTLSGSTHYAPGCRTHDAHDSCTYDAHDSCTYDAHDSCTYDAHDSCTYDAHDSCTYDAHDSCTYDAHDSMSGETFEAFIKRDMNQPKFGILRQPNAQGKKPFSVSLPYRLLGLKQFDTKC